MVNRAVKPPGGCVASELFRSEFAPLLAITGARSLSPRDSCGRAPVIVSGGGNRTIRWLGTPRAA